MFQRLLERMALALERHHIDYMVIGGQALLRYGNPRLTRDIDVTLGVPPDQVCRVLDAVETMGCAARVQDPVAFVAETFVLPCADTESGIPIDFVFSILPYEQQAMGRAQRVAMGAAQVAFASLEDLVIHKIVAGRAKDIEDLTGLVARYPSLDAGYVRKWLAEFEATTQQPLLDIFDTLYSREHTPAD